MSASNLSCGPSGVGRAGVTLDAWLMASRGGSEGRPVRRPG